MDDREKSEEDFINKSIEAYVICSKLLRKKISIITPEDEKQMIINTTISSSVKLADIKMHK